MLIYNVSIIVIRLLEAMFKAMNLAIELLFIFSKKILSHCKHLV